MAPSSNYMLAVALLVAFAAVAHPSAAARDVGAAAGGTGKAAAAAPAPLPNGDVVVHPNAWYEIPDLPIPGIIPCPPVFPKIPFIPCFNVTPPAPPPTPKECRTSLVKSLVPPCSGFLTNNSSKSEAPSDKCCDAVQLFFGGGDPNIYSFLCLCHVVNGDVSQLLPAPVNHTRALALMEACPAAAINAQMFLDHCNNDQSMKNATPPMDVPKPPTPAPGGKA